MQNGRIQTKYKVTLKDQTQTSCLEGPIWKGSVLLTCLYVSVIVLSTHLHHSALTQMLTC